MNMKDITPFPLDTDTIITPDELYSKWKWQHVNEDDEQWKLSCPKTKENGKEKIPDVRFKSSWNNDGKIDDTAKQIDVLFILAESNLKLNTKERKAAGEENGFWIRDEIIRESDAPIPRRLKMITAKIKGIDKDKLDNEWYKSIACINLNKRGGYSRCNPVQLFNYVCMYKEFIYRQIELISPQKICIMANSKVNQRVIECLELKEEIYSAYHPSYRSNTNYDEEYLKSIKKMIPLGEGKWEYQPLVTCHGPGSSGTYMDI